MYFELRHAANLPGIVLAAKLCRRIPHDPALPAGAGATPPRGPVL
jgi:hypothetical protein